MRQENTSLLSGHPSQGQLRLNHTGNCIFCKVLRVFFTDTDRFSSKMILAMSVVIRWKRKGGVHSGSLIKIGEVYPDEIDGS